MGTALPMDCSQCTSHDNSEWNHLCALDVQTLNQAKVVHHYKAGQTVFYQGNPPQGLFCIEKGTIVLRKTDSEGRSAIIRLAGAGQTLGYRAFFAGQPYSASAEASSDCTICWIDKASVAELLRRNPSLMLEFLKHVSQDLLEAEENSLRVATQSVRMRFAHLLLSFKDRESEVDDEGQIVLQLQLSRQDLASMLGTTPETIARLVKQFTTENIAIFDKRSVTIPDLDRLLDEVELDG